MKYLKEKEKKKDEESLLGCNQSIKVDKFREN